MAPFLLLYNCPFPLAPSFTILNVLRRIEWAKSIPGLTNRFIDDDLVRVILLKYFSSGFTYWTTVCLQMSRQ